MRPALLVVNPFSTRVTEQKVAEVERELERVVDLTVLFTQHHGHATELARDASGGEYEAVLVFSGDGVYNEVLNGLDGDVPLGFLPGGGTSVLSRALGYPVDAIVAAGNLADAIAGSRTRRISLGRVNGRRFAFSAGLGLDAEVVRRVDQLGRSRDGKRPGDLAFAVAVMRVIGSNYGHIEPSLEVKGLGRAAFAFVANGAPYTYARRIPLQLAPEADFELGLDLVAPVRVRRRSLVRTAYSLLSGHPHRAQVLYAHDADRIEIVCDAPTALQADGEDLGDVEEAVFEAERSAVSVFA